MDVLTPFLGIEVQVAPGGDDKQAKALADALSSIGIDAEADASLWSTISGWISNANNDVVHIVVSLRLETDPKASGADDSGVIHGFRDNSEAWIRDVDASA